MSAVKVRLTVTLPDGVVWFQSVEFPLTPQTRVANEMQPLFEWLVDRMQPWLV